MRTVAAGYTTDADRDRHRARGGLNRTALHYFYKLFSLCREFCVVATRQQNQKLLSSIPPHRIVGAYFPLQAARDRAKHFITHQVSPGVVDPLEMIDIRQQDAHGAPISSRAAQFAFE